MKEAQYYNCNGPTTRARVTSATDAYSRASGCTTMIELYEDGELIAVKTAIDSFKGFCRGGNPWEYCI